MNTYELVGTYKGTVLITIQAEDFQEALDQLDDISFDNVKVLNPSHIKFNPNEIKQLT